MQLPGGAIMDPLNSSGGNAAALSLSSSGIGLRSHPAFATGRRNSTATALDAAQSRCRTLEAELAAAVAERDRVDAALRAEAQVVCKNILHTKTP
jgi:hypothetical protein